MKKLIFLSQVRPCFEICLMISTPIDFRFNPFNPKDFRKEFWNVGLREDVRSFGISFLHANVSDFFLDLFGRSIRIEVLRAGLPMINSGIIVDIRTPPLI